MLPLTLIRRQITNRTIRSFLHYVPYVTLAVMTFPAILTATQSPVSGALALVGANAEKTVRGFHVDIAVCSCKGIDRQFGISDSNEQNAQIKRAMFAAAKRRILVADHSKFDQSSFVKISELTEMDTVVTDVCPDAAWTEALADADIELIY